MSVSLSIALAMAQSEEYLTSHRYLDMQALEDVPEGATARFEVLTHDTTLAR